MKKLLLFAVLACLSVVATAQEEGIRFGAKAGVNLAGVSGDNTDNLEGKAGIHIGALVEVPISDKFAFQPELLYSAQGYKLDTSIDIAGIVTKTETTMQINYINIPLMLKYYVAQGFSLQAGPQVGFLTSAEAEAKVSIAGISQSADTDVKDAFKGLDFGLNFGLGYQLAMGIFLDARYNLGLSDINDVDGSDIENKNAVIQLSVGYKF